MSVKPYFNTLEVQRVLAGKNTTVKVSQEQVEAIHQLFEKNTRAIYNLPKTLARYAATGAPVNFYQKPQVVADKRQEGAPTKPGFTK